MDLSQLNQLNQLKIIYSKMVASRESDTVEAELVNSGEANFLAASRGHEGAAILNLFLKPEDYLHCHYRDKALMLARGMSNEMFFLSALCKENSHSKGRQMVSHMSDPDLNILSLVGPVGNNTLQAAGIAHIIKNNSEQPIVYCAVGDGTSQQGEVLEAIAEAVRAELPVLFFIHNNDLAISTQTKGKTFFSYPDNIKAKCFYNTPITYLDGINPFESVDKVGEVVGKIRANRKPQIIVFNVDRLANHSNADDQKLYRTEDDIKKSFDAHDPIQNAKNYLLNQGVSLAELEEIESNTIQEVREAVNKARLADEPEPCFDAERPLPKNLEHNAPENRGEFTESEDRLTMIQALRETLNFHLDQNKNVILLGEDLEDGKGDVFGVTKGLSTKYPNRVQNSALTESTIMGVTTGMALAGARPVAFLQFADFMPIAYNQLMAEVGSMYWRTAGGWECPVIVMAACGAYKPGLGPFHSQTNESTVAHIPGVDLFMPSNAADAAGMLNAAFESQRPSVILYPKKLLNNASVQDTVSPDIQNRLIPIGKARMVKPGQDITLIGWGNTVEICLQTADILEDAGVDAEVIDLRTLKPYDLKTLLSSANKTGNVIVVHEDNHTCGLGGDILASIAEHAKNPVKVKRVTRADTFVPCNFPNQMAILPTMGSVLEAAADLLNLTLTWEEHAPEDASVLNVEVIGASPSDESVSIVELYIKPGDHVQPGQKLVDTEASKSSGEILSPCSGTIEEIFVEEADTIKVGEHLLRIKLDHIASPQQLALRTVRIPHLKRPENQIQNSNISSQNKIISQSGISKPCFKTGGRLVKNSELLKNFEDKSNEDILRTTGIAQRYWLKEDESILDLATDVSKQALESNNLTLSDISAVMCTTGTPEKYISPSMACLVLNQLYKHYGEQTIQAYDINAACSGYLYALQQARDYLISRPDEIVLLITAEALSHRLDQQDPDTAFLFADGATATIVYGENHLDKAIATIEHTQLTALAEDGGIINVPLVKNKSSAITLQGRKLFTFAVKNMALALQKCCQATGIPLSDIALGVPHQANQRITEAVERKLGLEKGAFYSNIEKYGNTSSCTIPIGLAETLDAQKSGDWVALAAFGGGFTIGAGLLKII